MPAALPLVAGAFLAAGSIATAVGLTTAFVVAGLAISWAAVLTITGVALLAVAYLARKTPKPDSGGQQLKQKLDPQAPVPVLYGRSATGGFITWRGTWGSKNAFYGIVTVLSAGGPIAGIESYKAGDYPIGFGGSPAYSLATVNNVGGYSGSSKLYKGKLAQRWQNGAAPANTTPGGASGLPIPAGAMSGLAHVITRYEYSNDAFPQGLPSSLWTASGVKLYDPRQDSTYPGGSGAHRVDQPSTWTYSENPFLAALQWTLGRYENGRRVYGIGAKWAEVDVASFVTGANVADANGWKVGGVVTTDDDKYAVLASLLAAGGGVPVARGAQIACTVNTPKTSVLTLTKDDIVGEVETSSTTSWRDRQNTIIPKYREETQGWEIIAGEQISSPVYIEEDGGEQKTVEVEFPLVQQAAQAHQLATYELCNSREFLTFTVNAKLRLLAVRVGDAITVNVPQIAAKNIKCTITGREFNPSDMSVTLSLKSETDAKHAFALGQSQVAPPAPKLDGYDPSNPGAPASNAWAITATQITKDETTLPVIVVTGATDDPNTSTVIVEYRPTGSDTWLNYGEFPRTTTKVEISGLTDGTAYDVALSYRTVRGVVGERLVLNATAGAFKVSWSSTVTGPNKPADNADVTKDNVSKDTSAVAGKPATAVLDEIVAADGKATSALNNQKDGAGNIVPVTTLLATADKDRQDNAKALSDAKLTLNADIANARQEGSTARQELVQAEGRLNTAVADAKKAGTDASTDLAAEVSRAKSAEGTLTTNLANVKQTADGAASGLNDEVITRTRENATLTARQTELFASVQGGGNLLQNTSFANNDSAGWTFESGGKDINYVGINLPDYAWHPTGENVLTLHQNNNDGATGLFSGGGWKSSPVSVIPGTYMQFYAYIAAHRAKVELAAVFYDADGNETPGTTYTGGVVAGSGGRKADADAWKLIGFKSVIVPSNASNVVFNISKWGTNAGEADSWMWVWRPYAGVAGEGQTTWNPYTHGDSRETIKQANSRITETARVAADATKAVADKNLVLEAQMNGTSGSNLLTKITDNATAAADATRAVGTRVNTIETSFNRTRETILPINFNGQLNDWSRDGDGRFYFEDHSGSTGWDRNEGLLAVWHGENDQYIFPMLGGINQLVPVAAGDKLRLTASIAVWGGTGRDLFVYFDKHGPDRGYRGNAGPALSVPIGCQNHIDITADNAWHELTCEVEVPQDTAFVRPILHVRGGGGFVRSFRVDRSNAVANTDARVKENAVAAATATKAVADKNLELEAKLTGTQNSGLLAKINENYSTLAGEDSAAARRLTTIESSATNSGNLIPNTSFETLEGWFISFANNGAFMARNKPDSSWQIGNVENNLTLQASNYSGIAIEAYSSSFAVEANEWYQVYALVAAHRCRAWVSIFFFDYQGSFLGYGGENFGVREGAGGAFINAHDIAGNLRCQAPPNAVRAQVIFRLYDAGNDGYAWFHRPYCGKVTAKTNEWNAYTPGDNRPVIAAANARIVSNAKTAADATKAVADRSDIIEAQLRGERGSSLLSTITDNATVAAGATSTLAQKVSTLASNSSLVAGNLIPNAAYTVWDDGQEIPAKWQWWTRNYLPTRIASGRNGGGYAYRVEVTGNGENGIAQMYDIGPVISPGYYIFEAEAELLSGTWRGAGLTLHGQHNLNFSTEADTAGNISATALGLRRFSKLIFVSNSNWRNWHPMDSWAGFGACEPKSLIWYRTELRPATAGEIFAKETNTKALATAAKLETEEATRISEDAALALRSQRLEASMSATPVAFTLVSRGLSGTGLGREFGLYNNKGERINGGGSMYNIATFNSSNQVDAAYTYNTLSSVDDRNNMRNFIANIPRGKTVVVWTFDEPQSNRTLEGIGDQMADIGAGPLFFSDKFQYRGAYALVGRKGIGRGNGVEAYQGSSHSAADAIVELRFDLLGGVAQMSGNGVAIARTEASISDEVAARTSATNALTTRATKMEASVNIVGQGVVGNDQFANWIDGAALPSGWVFWVQGGNFRASRITGLNSSPYAVYTQNDNAEVESGFYQGIVVQPGKYVIDVTVESDVSGLRGAGVTLGGVYNLDFLGDPDTNGYVGNSPDRVRSWSKTINVTHDRVSLGFHAMHGWTGFGRGVAAKYMKWHRLTLRRASAGEALSYTNSARIETEEATRISENAAAATRTSTLEASAATGGFLNPNAMFTRGQTNGFGAPYAWGQWSREGDGYYGTWGSGNGNNYGGKAVQIDRQGMNAGLQNFFGGYFSRGWYVLDCEVRFEDGASAGAGFHANFQNGYADQIDFNGDPDTQGYVGPHGNGNYKFTKMIYNGADSGTIGIYMMAGWAGFNRGYNGFLRTIWQKAGIRPATQAEVQAGKVQGIEARVSSSEGAIANVQAKVATAWSEKTVSAGTASATIMMRAVDDNGNATSDVTLAASRIALRNVESGGISKGGMSMVAGNAVFDGSITATTGIIVGTGKLKVQIAATDYAVSHDEYVSFGYDLGRAPSVVFGPCPVALNSGEVYAPYAAELSSTGFRAKLLINAAPQNTAQSTGAFTNQGGNIFQTGKGGRPLAANGQYTVTVNLSATATAYNDGDADYR